MKEKANEALAEAVRANDLVAMGAALAAGADIDAFVPMESWHQGDRPRLLHMALRKGALEAARELVARGASLSAKSEGVRGVPPLCWAGSEEAMRMLIEAGACPSSKNERGETAALRAAAWLKHPEAEPFFRLCQERGQDLEERDKEGRSALSNAARALNVDAVEALLKLGCDPNGRNLEGASALREAASGFSRQRSFLGRAKRVAIALILGGADPGLLDHQGHPPEINLTRFCWTSLPLWSQAVAEGVKKRERVEIVGAMRRRGSRGAGPKRI